METIEGVTASDLGVKAQGEGFGIFYHGDIPISTPAGHPVQHADPKFLASIIHELEESPQFALEDGAITAPWPFCSYMLYATQRDFYDQGRGMSDDDVTLALVNDPVFHPSPGPEIVGQTQAWKETKAYLRDLGVSIISLDFLPDVDARNAIRPLLAEWRDLSAARKAVVTCLSGHHFENIVSPLALVRRRCTPVEYSRAVLATTEAHAGLYGDPENPDEEASHRQVFRGVAHDAQVCLNYLTNMEPGADVVDLISGGENKNLEFKSTLRWNIKTQKHDDSVTHSCLKTIAAFLNTDGGTLLIGVADDGNAIGTEQDGLANDDKYLLHLFNLIKQRMGEGAAASVKAGIVRLGDKSVCRVDCDKSLRPVYLSPKQAGDDEFYVRMGPQTSRMPAKELHAYISEHF